MFKKHLKRFEKNLDLVLFPSVLLHNHRIRGSLTRKSILSAICEDFKDIPRACMSLFQSNQISPHYIVFMKEFWFLLILAIVLVIVGVFFIYKYLIEQKIHESIEANINRHITKYKRLGENRHKYSSIIGKDNELRPTEEF